MLLQRSNDFTLDTNLNFVEKAGAQENFGNWIETPPKNLSQYKSQVIRQSPPDHTLDVPLLRRSEPEPRLRTRRPLSQVEENDSFVR